MNKGIFNPKPGELVIVNAMTYNNAVLGHYGLGPDHIVEVTDVKPSADETHPPRVTVRLQNGSEHEFSGIYFLPAPGTHTN
jgi:hypothetical protein